MPWLVIRLRLQLSVLPNDLPPFPYTWSPALPSPPLPPPPLTSLSLSLPCPRKELHVPSFPKSLPFLLPMPWLVIRLRHLLCSCQSCPIPSRRFPIPALPSPPFPPPPLTSLSPCSRKELHVLSFPKSLPFLLPMPWLVIRLRHLLCSCQSCPIPSCRFSIPALPALPFPPFPPTSDLPFSLLKERTTCAILSQVLALSAAHALAGHQAAPSTLQLSVLPNPLLPFPYTCSPGSPLSSFPSHL